MALGIMAKDLAGNRIGFGRATGRHFAKILSVLTFGIGFLMAAFTERKQALHDMVAGTLVVRARLRRELQRRARLPSRHRRRPGELADPAGPDES